MTPFLVAVYEEKVDLVEQLLEVEEIDVNLVSLESNLMFECNQ